MPVSKGPGFTERLNKHFLTLEEWITIYFRLESLASAYRMDLPSESKFVRSFLGLLLGLDLMTRDRFNLNSYQLQGQKNLFRLAEFLILSRWGQEILVPMANEDVNRYNYLKLMRVISTTHTGAIYLDIPYPSLLCLFFQESMLDYRLVVLQE